MCAAIFIMLAAGMALAADKYPSPRGMAVNDFANVIDPENAAKMESLGREILQKTGAAMVVATVTELGPTEEISLYVNGLYKAWGIGKKGEDRGVLIFLAVKERKIRIETGYGVEGVLTDGIIGEILDKYVVPQLKAGETGKALYNAMLACGAYLAKDKGVQLTGVAGPYRTKARPAPANKGFNIVWVIIFIIAAIVLLGTKSGRSMLPWILLLLLSSSGRGGGGGGFGGGFGGFGGGASGGGGAGRDF